MQNPDSEYGITNYVYLRGNLRDGTGVEPGEREQEAGAG